MSNPTSSSKKSHSFAQNKRGRPRLSYLDSSDKTKKRGIDVLLEKYTHEELIRAADSLRSNSINQSVSENKIKKADKDLNVSLAMYMDLEMTEDKY